MSDWTFTEQDADVAAQLQGEFLPPRMFDVHAHVYRVADLGYSQPNIMNTGPQRVTVDEWRRHLAQQTGSSRHAGGLFFPDPIVPPERIDSINDFVTEQLGPNPQCRGLIVVYPRYAQGKTVSYLEHPQIAGFKVYHTLSDQKPTFEAGIESFLPDWAWALANERGLVIMLHLVKKRALADPDNQAYIQRYCSRFPNAKLVLAHAARGFHAPNTITGLAAVTGIENLYFDMSGVCEAAPLSAIIRAFGPRKLMWGSDFPVSQIRGKCVTVGDGFAWLQSDTVHWDRLSPECHPTLVGLESLMALRRAAGECALSPEDIQDICCDNALRLLGMSNTAGDQTQDLYRRALQRIPGGTQLLSKRPELFAPEQWPAYFREARGCEVWDLDGRHYYDMSTNAVGSCLLGYGDADVNAAVQRRISFGSMCSLNPPEEVELADVLCGVHPWAEQARFARCGGESVAMAVRIARATTGRSCVAICGYHGWQDWYLAANLGDQESLRGHLLPGLEPLGVPSELRDTCFPFHFNQPDELQAIIREHGNHLAAVVMEPCRFAEPQSGFLEFVKERAHACGALLVFDEISIGWRLHLGGAHLKFGVDPDIAVFAKALGNGYPMGAVIGTKSAMAGAHDSFISSTYWTESLGPVAALATIAKMRRVDVPGHVARVGERIMKVWHDEAAAHDLPVVTGESFPCFAHSRFDHQLEHELRTLYTQSMLARGFLAGTMTYPTLAHTDAIVSRYETAIGEVFGSIAGTLEAGRVREALKGPVAQTGFRRLT